MDNSFIFEKFMRIDYNQLLDSEKNIEEIENADGKINIPDLNKKIPVLSNLFSLKLEKILYSKLY